MKPRLRALGMNGAYSTGIVKELPGIKVGWFDNIEDMHTTADAHKGLTGLPLDEMSEVDADQLG